jgi:signal recognition particle subunit SRP54
MGDIVGLVKDFEEHVDEREAERDAARLLKGQFGLDDLLKQLKMVQRLGPLRDVVAKLPMFGQLADQVEESQLVRVESLIGSMTPAERKRPELIDKSRARRIARGSGRRSSDVRELVSRFEQMRDMMAGLGAPGGLLSKIPGMGRLVGAGGLDPSALLGGGAGAGDSRRSLAKRRSQQRDKRKQARKSRKKNRRR